VAHRVVVQRIGSELGAAPAERPAFGRSDERRAEAATAGFRADIPALEVGDPVRGAALGVGPDVQLGEADRPGTVDRERNGFQALGSIIQAA
jgi:hypothetical protein